MTILGFSKKEIFSVFIIIFLIAFVTYTNLQTALRRGRDNQRKNDLWVIHDALISYHKEFYSFPPSFEGKIVACFGGVDANNIPQARPCDWHRDGLPNIFSGTEYLKNLPTDPKHLDGARYYYISTGRYFQLYGALEGEDEDEYQESIVKRNIMCGNRVCNIGRSSFNAPLDKSIEEYENEMREKQKNEMEKGIYTD